MPFLPLLLALVLATVACSSSNTAPEDAAVDLCGNGVLDPGEQCDSGDPAGANGCGPDCRWEALCGNGIVEGDEVCDDGNNISGDGCRSDCLSDETCGNMLVDWAAGEVCDSTPGCSEDCTEVLTCGNDVLDDGEQCDDGNLEPYDGCGPDCRVEVALIIDSLAVADADVGCDYTGNGQPDNGLGAALGAEVLPIVNGLLTGELDVDILLEFLGLEDISGANDSDFLVRVAEGEPAGGEASEYLIAGPGGDLEASFQSVVADRRLTGGPTDLALAIDILPLQLRRARIEGQTHATDEKLSGLNPGLLCGAVPVHVLAQVPNLVDEFGADIGLSAGAPCDGSEGSTLADLLVGGATIRYLGTNIEIPGAPADVDLDSDGIEVFEVLRDGPEGCQPIITACIDGDGTRVEGRDCVFNTRFQDGVSAAIQVTAAAATIVGLIAPAE
jgi:cysteine-rich repeat protein